MTRLSPKITIFVLCIVALFQLPIYFSQGVGAASSGATVAPAVVKASVSRQSPISDQSVSVRNDFSVPLQFSAQLFNVDQQSGKLLPTDQKVSPILSSISLSQTLFELQPGQSINLLLRATYNDKLSPGGSYASLVIKPVKSQAGNVSLQQAISVSIFLYNEDGLAKKVAINSVSYKRTLFSLPREVLIELRNDGNTDFVPAASVTIQDGAVVLNKATYNQNSVPLFPKRTLRLSEDLTTLKKVFLPAKIDLITSARVAGSDEVVQQKKSFWYVPFTFVILMIIIAILAATLLAQQKRKRTNKEVKNTTK